MSWMMSLTSGYFSGVSCPGATRLLAPCPSPSPDPTSCVWPAAAPSAGGILRQGHPTYTCAVPPWHTLCVDQPLVHPKCVPLRHAISAGPSARASQERMQSICDLQRRR